MRRLLAAGLALGLSACASTSETNPGRTATEQLLMARAADLAVEDLRLPIPDTARVYVESRYLQGEGAAYAASAVRSALSRAGHALADDRHNADAVFELRAGALSLEQMRRVVGLPPLALPINENLNVVSIPELSLYSRRDRVGVAEFSGFVYDARTGAPLGAVSPMIGEYRIRSHKVLMMVTWGQQSARPGERDPGDSWREF
ncbi:DUF6655 family protein [Brevundimonas aurifodinae]|uniref:DUF6655 family protein n=2 Tax=Brevundimonas TaxID=41275 RepID=A0ABV1NS70_9CAUL|nr:MAG: hypothetical protein B7Z42_01270 [Brevundimonas sp. 12-68-7]OYX32325.1 MAG: hypothetical protein B7Z01_11180 [Brevundimonas subvibrioides]